MRPSLAPEARAALLLAAGLLASCASVLGLDELEKVSCTRDCPDAGSSTGNSGSAGGPSIGGAAGSAAVGGTGNVASGGTANGGGSFGGSTPNAGTSSDAGESAGGGATTEGCGGDEPPTQWTEHWYEHDQVLTRTSYRDCVATYADPDMAVGDVQWVSEFVNEAWAYTLENYGHPSDSRLFTVLHQGKYDADFLAGHSAVYYEDSHDFRNVMDLGAADWTTQPYDLPAHVLSYVLEFTAVPGKQGSPASWIWGNEAFAEIYKYDLYVGLGMTDVAEEAFDTFEPTKHSYPVPESYWFADFYYPVWRDYGKTQVLVKFFELLEQHYPATNGVMASMSWGEYIHFMSGAAGHEVKTQATYAFGWFNEWEAELDKAKSDYPQITY